MEIVRKMILATWFSHSVRGIFVVQSKENFPSTRNNCNLATPRINFTANGPTIYLGSIEGLDNGETAWIGYTQDYEIFQFLGCVDSSHIQRPIQMSITIEKNIGQCQFFCRSYQYFGVKALAVEGVDCRCINVTDPLFTTNWLSPCNTRESDNEFLIGDNSSFAIYKTGSREAQNALKRSYGWANQYLNCTEIHMPSSNIYRWNNCSGSLKVLCRSKNDSTIWEPASKKYLSWKDASERCLRNNTVLIPYQTRSVFNETNRPQYWTSNIRAYVISTVKESSFTGPTQYGYVKRSGDQYILHFEPKSSNTSRKALCEDIWTSISQPAETSSIFYKTTRETVHPYSYSSSESILVITGGSTAGNENVAVFIVVPPVIVLLIVGGVIGGIFIWRRSKAKQTKADDDHYHNNVANSCETNELYNDHRPNSSEVYNEIGDIVESTHVDYDIIKDNLSFELERNSVNNLSYSVLEKVKNNQFQVVENDDYDFAREQETNEIIPKDHIHHVSENLADEKTTLSKSDKNIENGYTKVIPKNVAKRADLRSPIDFKANTTDTDYDHLDQVNKKPKGQHQIASDDGNAYDKKNESNTVDMYDHIKDGILDKRMSFTGNAMGFNALSKTYNKWKDAPFDSNDTYNHVNQLLNGSFDEQLYNTTNIQPVKQVENDNPYDHTCTN